MPHNDTLSRRALLMSGGAAVLTACAGSTVLRPQGTPGSATSPAGDGALPESDVARMMKIAGVPGMSVAIVDGARIDARGHGVTRAPAAPGGATSATADATSSQPVTGDTVVEAASLSKPVFAYLVMQLVTDGLLDLDRPLVEYLPLPNPDDARARAITARHVLSHSSGWRNWRNTAAQTLTADFEPGSRFGYSGEGYYFLGRVLEKLTGQGILRLSRERVLDPLGMASTSYLWSPEIEPRRAEPHNGRGIPVDSFGARNGKAVREAATAAGKSMRDWTHDDAERLQPAVNKDFPALPNFLLPNVAGSMLTTANDYARFLTHLMRGAGRPHLERMMTPATPINDALRWGLGVGLQSHEGRTQFWHWGDNFGFKNFFVADPQRGTAIVVFTNGQNGRAIYERVVRASRGDQPAFLWI